MDISFQQSTKVIISLSEEEAGKLNKVLTDVVDFGAERWAAELTSALDRAGVHETDYVEDHR